MVGSVRIAKGSKEISKEEKLAIVKRCLSGELGVCEASRPMGVTQENLALDLPISGGRRRRIKGGIGTA